MENIFVTFDIDGTLIKTTIGNYEMNKAVNMAAIELVGIDQDIKSYLNTTFSGRTDYWIGQELINKACPNCKNKEEMIQKFLQLEKKYFDIYDSNNFMALPGSVKLLEYLTTLPNVHLGLCTGNQQSIAWSKLESVNLKSFFPKFYGGFGDICERDCLLRSAIKMAEEGENLHFDRIIHIGDAKQDESAALAVNAIPILVETGGLKMKDFQGPCFVVKDFVVGFDDIVSVIKTGKPIHDNIKKY